MQGFQSCPLRVPWSGEQKVGCCLPEVAGNALGEVRPGWAFLWILHLLWAGLVEEHEAPALHSPQHGWAGLSLGNEGSAGWGVDGWTAGQTAGHLSDPVAGPECSHRLPGLVKAVLQCVPLLSLPSMAQ